MIIGDEPYKQAAAMLIDAGLVTPETDIASFFTGMMAAVMDEFGLGNHPAPPAKKKYKLDVSGDPRMAADLKLMNTDSGFELPKINNLDLPGKTICITGQSLHYPRKTLQELAVKARCIIDNRITINTDYLIVCEKASKGWAYEKFGQKMKTAVERGVTLVSEQDFLEALRKVNVLDK